MPINKEKILKVRQTIEKRFGQEAVVKINKDSKVDFVSSGSILLDHVLGGGWAKGRICELYGRASSGKTSAAIHAAVEVQKLGKAVGYVDTEQAMDPVYMKALGLDMSEDMWLLSQPDNAEQAMEIVREMCEEPEFGLIVLDSVAGLTPTAVLQGEAGDAKIGLVARLMSQQLNILKNICKKNGNILMCINQVREKIGGGFGFGAPTTETTGGNALKFYASQRVEFARIGSEKEGGEQVANKTRCTVKKNKVAIPFKKCDISIRFGVGFDKIQEILNLAVEQEVCKKKGSFFYWGEERLGQGLAQTRENLEKDPALFEELKNTVVQKLEDDENNGD